RLAPLDWPAWAWSRRVSRISARRRRFCTSPNRTIDWPICTRKKCGAIAACIKISRTHFGRQYLEALIFWGNRRNSLRRSAIHQSARVSLLRQESRGARQNHGATIAHGGVLLAYLRLGRL